MIVGVPKEVKANENRVALTPGGAASLIHAGHRVLVESEAGTGSGFSDDLYREVGAEGGGEAAEVWAEAEMIRKVKERMESERPQRRPDRVMCTVMERGAPGGRDRV